MKLSHFQTLFLIRFLSYFLIQVGIITTILTIEPVITEEAKYNFDHLFGNTHSLPKVVTSADQDQTGAASGSPVSFGEVAAGDTGGSIVPVSTDFGIVIEKINANAKVIPDVDPSNERDYSQALAQGVAHAKGTVFPGQKGNMYLFSHSVDAPWNIVRFNAIFYLLSKLDTGDRVIMFYKGRRYDYVVFDKTIAKPEDTHFLTDSYNVPVLTLQTCDPPGTLANRLLVRAKLAGS